MTKTRNTKETGILAENPNIMTSRLNGNVTGRLVEFEMEFRLRVCNSADLVFAVVDGGGIGHF